MSDNVFAPPRASLDVHEGPGALWEMTFKEVRKLYLASVNIRALGILYGLGAVGAVAGGAILMTATTGSPNADAMPRVVWALVIALGLVYVAACVSSYTR